MVVPAHFEALRARLQGLAGAADLQTLAGAIAGFRFDEALDMVRSLRERLAAPG